MICHKENKAYLISRDVCCVHPCMLCLLSQHVSDYLKFTI